MNQEEMKICKKCGQPKPKSEFYKDSRELDKLMTRCKDCFHKRTEQKDIINTLNEYANIKEMFKDNDYDIDKNKTTHYSALWIGSSKSGKSTQIKHVLNTIDNKYDLIVVFSNSLSDPMYSFIDYSDNSKYIAFEEFDAKVIGDLFSLNKAIGNALSILLLFDDCISHSSKDAHYLTQCFTRGRNSGISIIFSTQSPVMIGRVARSNANYIFICKNNSPLINETISDNFIDGVIPVPNYANTSSKRKEYYKQFLMEKTKDYHSIVVDLLNCSWKPYKVNL